MTQVTTLCEMLQLLFRREGYEIIRPGAAYVDDDDITVDLESAIAADGMLHLLIERAVDVYAESGLSRGGIEYPFVVEEEPDALMGYCVRWRTGVTPLSVALLCAMDAAHQLIEMNPDPRPVLLLE